MRGNSYHLMTSWYSRLLIPSTGDWDIYIWILENTNILTIPSLLKCELDITTSSCMEEWENSSFIVKKPHKHYYSQVTKVISNNDRLIVQMLLNLQWNYVQRNSSYIENTKSKLHLNVPNLKNLIAWQQCTVEHWLFPSCLQVWFEM
jgi:hypothetical protein